MSSISLGTYEESQGGAREAIVHSALQAHGYQKTSQNGELFFPHVTQSLAPFLSDSPSLSGKKVLGIPGREKLSTKDGLWSLLEGHFGREEASKIMPESWLLSSPNQRALFLQQHALSQRYLLKKNQHGTQGIKLFQPGENLDQATYWGYKVAQKFQQPTLLVSGHKISLRLYLLITAQGDQLQGFLHRQGRCIYSNERYQDECEDSWITSIDLDQSIYKKNPQTIEELEAWLYLHDFSPQQLHSSLKSMLQKVLEASASTLPPLPKEPFFFQVFGFDVILGHREERKLHPYILEMNSGPSLVVRSEVDFEIKFRVIHDMLTEVNSSPLSPLFPSGFSLL